MWVLLEEQKSTPAKPLYFKGWEGYEPVTTKDLRKAHKFDSKQDAKLSAAYRHKSSFFVPQEVDVVVKNRAAA